MGRKKKKIEMTAIPIPNPEIDGKQKQWGKEKKMQTMGTKEGGGSEVQTRDDGKGKRETLSQRATRWGNELSSLQRHYYGNINSDFFVQIACIKFSAPKEMIPKVNGSFPTFSPLPSPFLPPPSPAQRCRHPRNRKQCPAEALSECGWCVRKQRAPLAWGGDCYAKHINKSVEDDANQWESDFPLWVGIYKPGNRKG